VRRGGWERGGGAAAKEARTQFCLASFLVRFGTIEEERRSEPRQEALLQRSDCFWLADGPVWLPVLTLAVTRSFLCQGWAGT